MEFPFSSLDRTYEELKPVQVGHANPPDPRLDRTYEELKLAVTEHDEDLLHPFGSYL